MLEVFLETYKGYQPNISSCPIGNVNKDKHCVFFVATGFKQAMSLGLKQMGWNQHINLSHDQSKMW